MTPNRVLVEVFAPAMSVTTWSCPVEPVGRSATSVPWSSAGDPSLAAIRSPSLVRGTLSATQKTQQVLSLSTSLVAHVVAIVAISVASSGQPVRWVPVQRGTASIELQASLGGPVEEATQEGGPAALLEKVEFLNRPAPVTEAVPIAATVAAIDRPIPRVDLSEVIVASVAAMAEPAARVVPTRFERPVSEGALAETAAQSAATSPRPPRADVGRHRLAELPAEAAVAPASPTSQASEGAETVAPTAVYNPAPAYPLDALAARLTGRVLLRVQVAADGSVLGASVERSSGVASLDASALATVRQWRFSPAADANASSRTIAVPIRFVLADT